MHLWGGGGGGGGVNGGRWNKSKGISLCMVVTLIR